MHHLITNGHRSVSFLFVWSLLAGLPGHAQTSHDTLYPPAPPNQLEMTVAETAGIARVAEMVRSGVPLPRTLNISNTSTLAVLDSSMSPIAAEFQILARWDAGLEIATAPIQWLLVTFPVTVGANESETYLLVTDGSVANPAPAQPLSVSTTQNGNDILNMTIDTGAAQFTLGNQPNQLFDQVSSGGRSVLVGGDMQVQLFDPDDTTLQQFGHATQTSIEIESQGPLCCIVLVKGAYDMPPRGDSPSGSLVSERRYVFHSGSPTVRIRHSVVWYGSYCDLQNEWPYIQCDPNGPNYDTVNGLHFQQVRNSLQLGFTPLSIDVRAEQAQPATIGTFSNQEIVLSQNLRPDRFSSQSYQLTMPGAVEGSGQAADHAYLAAIGVDTSAAIALKHMNRFEPQALRMSATGDLILDIVNDGVWISGRQGFYSEMAITAIGQSVSPPFFEQHTWAPLNQPLIAWPGPVWFASSNAVEPSPWLPLQGELAQYDTNMQRLMDNTLANLDYKGINGMMTFGLYPRYWTDSVRTDELDCNDPTPTYDWDNAFWCGSWTDYHNTVKAVPIWAMRSGDTQLLHELAFPAALRSLYTQAIQCSESDPWFYCGQLPTGYGGYRSDFNSSHAYSENMIMYYWLTGDRTVLDRLQVGAFTMRDYLCEQRPTSACDPQDTNSDYWAFITGRSTSQWNSIFRFLGLASNDSSFLVDFKTNMARAMTQAYVEQTWTDDGEDYGFWLADQLAYPYSCPPWRAPNNPDGNPERYYWTDQLWMMSLYDLHNVFQLKQDTFDLSTGNPAILPSQVIGATARTMNRFAANVLGANGDPNGDWPNQLLFLYDEDNRVGGFASEPCSTEHPADNPPCINRNPQNAISLPAAVATANCVTAFTGGGDPLLYETGKCIIGAHLVRGGLMEQDVDMIETGRNLIEFGLQVAWVDLSSTGGNQTLGSPFGMALGKIMGEYSARTHSAVALLAAYDAGVSNCTYPSVIGSSTTDCMDFMALIDWWSEDAQNHPSVLDLLSNSQIDVSELIATLNCAGSCMNP